ncbi:MAG: hypothetical protein Q4G64_02725 [bacterium]|nr:hypothetical protein [bacterium]
MAHTHERTRPMPVARVRMVPLALGGLALWAIGLLVILIFDLGTLARDIAIVGAALGLIATAWAERADSRRRPTQP